MPPLQDLTGKVFGRLMVRCRSNDQVRPSGVRVPKWWCLCLCGKILEIEGGDLRRGTTVSCGCYGRENCKNINKTHGESKTLEYSSWIDMHRRCYNPKDKNYKHYGGRGIKICEHWNKDNPEGLNNFIKDMGRKISKEFTIERIDVNGDYEPSNCKWVIKAEQARNRRSSVKLRYGGIIKIQSEWARELDINPTRIIYHIKQGKSFEEIYNMYSSKKVTGETGYAI